MAALVGARWWRGLCAPPTAGSPPSALRLRESQQRPGPSPECPAWGKAQVVDCAPDASQLRRWHVVVQLRRPTGLCLAACSHLHATVGSAGSFYGAPPASRSFRFTRLSLWSIRVVLRVHGTCLCRVAGHKDGGCMLHAPQNSLWRLSLSHLIRAARDAAIQILQIVIVVQQPEALNQHPGQCQEPIGLCNAKVSLPR
jgi:hypothetical protein